MAIISDEKRTSLLSKLKLSIGDFSTTTDKDTYYFNKIDQAINDLASDDISVAVLESEIGLDTIVVYAINLINDIENVANSRTLNLLRNKLSILTKGVRYEST